MSNKLKELKKQMILVYGLKCWISGIEDLKLTGHHIVPVRDNGKTVWNNIALLSRKQHDLFNFIENKDFIIAKKLNELFYELNLSMSPPNNEYYKEIECLLSIFKEKYKDDITSKGKILIKDEYIKWRKK